MPMNALHQAFLLEDHAVGEEPSPASLAEIKALVAALPGTGALMEKDEHGRTPLFCALDNCARLEIMQVLIDACADAILECNLYGELPLQCMLRGGSMSSHLYQGVGYTPAHVRALIAANPACLKLGEERDGLPLQVALLNGVNNVEHFIILLEGSPEACEVKDCHGPLPLVWALENGVDFAVTEALPVEVVDGDGNIPLISACRNNVVSLDAIDLLAKASLNVLLASNRRRRVVLP